MSLYLIEETENPRAPGASQDLVLAQTLGGHLGSSPRGQFLGGKVGNSQGPRNWEEVLMWELSGSKPGDINRRNRTMEEENRGS